MAQHSWSKLETFLPHGFLEQTGVLTWLISVLVIALRVAIMLIPQPTFLQALRFSTTILYSIAIIGAAIGIIVGCATLWGRKYRPNMQHPPRLGNTAAKTIRRSWPSPSRIAAVTIECLLAATIVQTATSWAEQSALSKMMVGQLIGIGALHIALAVHHEVAQRGNRTAA